MAGHVDFHILKESGQQAVFQYVSRLLQAGLLRKQKYYIHTSTQDCAHALDEYLWQAEPERFIPHNLIGEGPYPSPPVQIGWQTEVKPQQNTLINLSTDIPACANQFNRIIEIAANEDAPINAARNKYRQYREQGHQIAYQDHRKHERA